MVFGRQGPQKQSQSGSASSAVATEGLTPDMFAPRLANMADAERISRPILTYFQDAMVRFRSNRMGMACLGVLLFITLTGIVGPFFFPKGLEGTRYENVPNTDFQNQNPTKGEELLVLEDGWAPPDAMVKEGFRTDAPLLTPEKLTPPTNLKVEGLATVNGVTLSWEPMEGVSGYAIYRISAKAPKLDLETLKNEPTIQGMVLGRVENPAEYSYTDSSGLDPSEHYGYAVVSYVVNPETQEETLSTTAAVVEVSVRKSIPLSDAQMLDANAEVGKSIRGRTYVFGTDSLGRDVFARMIQGTRVNFSLAVIVPTLCLFIGLVYGALSGLVGGKVDLVLMRIIEVLDTLPYLLLMIILQLVMGKGMMSLIIAMVAFGWTGFARIIRGEVLRLREIEFVHASRLLGAPLSRLIFKHIAPNLIGLILVIWSSRLPAVIVSEAFLSLLGLGLEPPTASWGMVLNEAAQRFQAQPIQFLLPGAVMAVTLLAFFLLGDALTDALDPKLRGRD